MSLKSMEDRMGEPEKDHQCGRVWAEGGTVHSEGVESIGGCSSGCCDDYRCLGCGKEFRIEWPD